MIKSKIAFKVSNKLLKLINIELSDYCSTKLVKNKDLVSKVQKYYLITKNQTKVKKKLKELKVNYKTYLIF